MTIIFKFKEIKLIFLTKTEISSQFSQPLGDIIVKYYVLGLTVSYFKNLINKNNKSIYTSLLRSP
jgi:hypothetical protein